MVDMNYVRNYEPRWPGVKELNLADQWRARWVDEQELPAEAPVNYAYAMLLLGDKAYAVRPAGGKNWGMVEGATGDTPAEDWLAMALKEQANATAKTIALVGFYECKATRLNTEFEQGALTVRPLYVVSAKSVDDMPDGSAFERRRFPLNEYMVAMRARYPELLDQLTTADHRYAVLRAKGQA